MKIGGIQKFSLIDYPGKISAIVFTQGCNFSCPYCHNPELHKLKDSIIKEEEIFDFLKKRQGKLDAIVVTGGEPTLNKDLPDFIRKIKALGFLVKLDSNGTNPEMLKILLADGLLDYIAMDIKGPIEKYHDITRSKTSLDDIKQSISIIIDSKIPHEFRTTVVKSQLAVDDFPKIANLIKGADAYYLQKFSVSKHIDESFKNEETYSDQEFEQLKTSMLKDFSEIGVR